MSFPRRIQDLSPTLAHLFLEVERFCRCELNFNPDGENILVAISGGPDSTALLCFSKIMSTRWKANLSAAHLDHGIRPESGLEAERVRQLCDALGIPLELDRIQPCVAASLSGKGVEESLRRLRYEFLEGARQKSGSNWIILGHQLNDLAEDILLRLVRGTGWPGLSGMPGIDRDRRLLRPFLLTPRQTLIDLLQDLDMTWIEDPSNRSMVYRRNRIRHQVLPLMERENPAFLSTVAQLWRMGRADQAFWQDRVSALLAAIAISGDRSALPMDLLRHIPQAERLRLFKRLLDDLGPGQVLSDGLLRLDRAVDQGLQGKIFRFPGHKRVRIGVRGLSFQIDIERDSRNSQALTQE